MSQWNKSTWNSACWPKQHSQQPLNILPARREKQQWSMSLVIFTNAYTCIYCTYKCIIAVLEWDNLVTQLARFLVYIYIYNYINNLTKFPCALQAYTGIFHVTSNFTHTLILHICYLTWLETRKCWATKLHPYAFFQGVYTSITHELRYIQHELHQAFPQHCRQSICPFWKTYAAYVFNQRPQ